LEQILVEANPCKSKLLITKREVFDVMEKKIILLTILLIVLGIMVFTSFGRAKAEGTKTSVWDKAQEMMDEGKYEDAVTLYSLAIEGNKSNPDIYDAYFSRGIAFSHLKNFDKAYSDYSMAIELKPSFKEAYLERGLLQLVMKKLTGAIADFSKVIKLDSKNYVAYANRASANFILGKSDEALADIEKSIEINPDCAGCHYSHYKILWSLERDNEADKAFEKARLLNPNFKRLGGD